MKHKIRLMGGFLLYMWCNSTITLVVFSILICQFNNVAANFIGIFNLLKIKVAFFARRLNFYMPKIKHRLKNTIYSGGGILHFINIHFRNFTSKKSRLLNINNAIIS